ncbi:MAG TPA: hypothetical protein ENL43_02845 [candidate division WOR-3 bacterium]|uniref:Bifunctional metallophosphatase/5'-nucleotidase n=1 Tax=candidate division WOR-3 bacterium TaxID=2052148 RepID=A0A7V5HP33_UNCW3|nr:hypothetical protein [candidate division WOR-3 bacterium]
MKVVLLFSLLFGLIPKNAKKVELIFTNNIEGVFSRTKATWINPDFPPPVGSKGSFLTFLKEERKKAIEENIALFLFDAGNFTGGFITGENLPLEETIKYFKEAKYDVINLGVREFILPYKKESGSLSLEAYIKSLETPCVGSNIRLEKEPDKTPPFIKPYLILEKNDIKIGVFGLVNENLPFFALEKNIKGLLVTREKETARKIVKRLKDEGVDIIVLLSSLGYYRDIFLAEDVPGIDVICGGFDGPGLRYAYVDSLNHTIIMRNYSGFSQAGKLILYLDPATKKILNFEFQAVSLLEEEIPIEE